MGSAAENIDDIDNAIDEWWDRRLRDRPALDRLMYSASEAANHSLLWYALGSAQAVVRRDARGAWQLGIALLGEAALVNGVIKTLVGRRRPALRGPRPHSLRQPLTSSFPSGHASAAMVAASLLSRRSPWAPAYYAVALVVALSRIHVRIHHASDVTAGLATGTALGAVARRLLR